MTDMQRTSTVCIGMICATLTITITSHNLTRQPKSSAVQFYEACALNAEALQRRICAELAVREEPR